MNGMSWKMRCTATVRIPFNADMETTHGRTGALMAVGSMISVQLGLAIAVTLIEDVITTGGAVRNAALAPRSDNANVSNVICAIDRRTETGDVLNDVSVAVLAVLTKSDLDGAQRPPL